MKDTRLGVNECGLSIRGEGGGTENVPAIDGNDTQGHVMGKRGLLVIIAQQWAFHH